MFRLRLIHLLGSLTFLSFGFGFWRFVANPYYTQFAAFSRFEGHGCSLKTEPATTQWHRYFVHPKIFIKVVELNAQRNTLTDEKLADLKLLPHLRKLTLDNNPITSKGLVNVSALKQLDELSLSNTLVTDDGIECLGQLEKLRVIRIDRTRITDDAMPGLAELDSLSTLKLSERVTIDGLRQLEAMPKLQLLDASRTFIPNADLESLSGLATCRVIASKSKPIEPKVFPPLESQRLTHEQWQQTWVRCQASGRRVKVHLCNLSDADLKGIESIQQLSTIEIKGTMITDQGLEYLSRLTNLHRFVLAGEIAVAPYCGCPDISDAGIEHVAKMTNLRYLGLMNLPIRGDRFASLSALVELSILDLSGSTIQDECLEHVMQLPKLQHLHIYRTSVSQKCIENFQRQRPDVSLYHDLP